jgi:hypothetical protein
MEVRIPPNTFDDLRPFWLKRQAQKRCRPLTPVERVQLLLKTERADNERSLAYIHHRTRAQHCITAGLSNAEAFDIFG